jgi:hypothetical protein
MCSRWDEHEFNRSVLKRSLFEFWGIDFFVTHSNQWPSKKLHAGHSTNASHSGSFLVMGWTDSISWHVNPPETGAA